MEELVDDDGVDLETLKAQIDLSLAETQNLVASWLKPGRVESSSTIYDQEKEIQELLKRPPRLGVGAPIPASTGTLGHETNKLKNKLVGKKRARDVEDDTAKVEQSEDEEESRAGAIKKKARVDPFAGSGKGKKQESYVTEHKDEPSPPKSQSGTKTSEVQAQPDEVESPGKVSADETKIASPSKKKKKKKNRHKDSEDDVEHAITAAPVSPISKTISTSNRPRTPSPVGTRRSEVPETPVNLSTPQPSGLAAPKPQSPGNGLSVLNLDGPPSAFSPSPSKKKRKRNKKKKKKKHAQEGESAEPQVEAQDDEEEDE